MQDGLGNASSGSFPGQVGETFLAFQDGEISTIEVGFETGGDAGTYELYVGTGGGGSLLPAVVVASVVFAVAPITGQVLILNLTTPFPVVNGTMYRFAIDNTGGNANFDGHFIAGGAHYPHGDFTFNTGTNTSFDLDFKVQIQAANTPPDPNISTLSEWGLTVLVLLFMIIGTAGVMRVREVRLS